MQLNTDLNVTMDILRFLNMMWHFLLERSNRWWKQGFATGIQKWNRTAWSRNTKDLQYHANFVSRNLLKRLSYSENTEWILYLTEYYWITKKCSSYSVRLLTTNPVSRHWNRLLAAGKTSFPDSWWSSYEVIPHVANLLRSQSSCSSRENLLSGVQISRQF